MKVKKVSTSSVPGAASASAPAPGSAGSRFLRRTGLRQTGLRRLASAGLPAAAPRLLRRRIDRDLGGRLRTAPRRLGRLDRLGARHLLGVARICGNRSSGVSPAGTNASAASPSTDGDSASAAGAGASAGFGAGLRLGRVPSVA